jgi:hypothetical protein
MLEKLNATMQEVVSVSWLPYPAETEIPISISWRYSLTTTNFVHHRRPRTSFTGDTFQEVTKKVAIFTLNNNGTGVALYPSEAFKQDSKTKVNNAR